MTVPVIHHEEAEAVGALLAARIVTHARMDSMAWADVVQLVLLKAREVVAAREAQADRALRDSEVSRPPVTRTIGDIQAEIAR